MEIKEVKKREEEAIGEESKLSILLEDLNYLQKYIEDLFSFLPLPVCSVSPSGIILEIDPAFERISGYKSEEILGMTFDEIFDKERTTEILKNAEKKGTVVQGETKIFTKEKKEIPVNLSVTLRRDEGGELMGYFFALFDLTEIKNYQKGLEEKTENLEASKTALMNILEDVEEARRSAEEEKNKTLAIITNFVDGILIFDKENKLSLINSQAEKFFDIKGRDIIGRGISELLTFPTLKPVMEVVGEEIKKIFRKEVQLKENLILEVTTDNIVMGEERVGSVIVLHDVTREKVVEKMKTEFVSVAAHQLRTPISAIKWTLKMILDGDLGEITPEQREFIEKTYQSNERMINLINDLLDVTRIEEGRYLYNPILTNFEPLCERVINAYQDEMKRKKIKFEFRKPKEKLPQVKVDVEKIQLAIQNLLENAIRYTPEGGAITISLKKDEEEKVIEFSIKDTGIGIPKNQQYRIFTKFFRGENAIKTETEGSGLGLFITKNIIEAHGGEIWFKSEEGKGTTFFFTLPFPKEFESFLKSF